MAETFYTQIAANRRNSFLLALIVIVLFGALGFSIGYALSGSAGGAVAVMIGAIVLGGLLSVGSYFGGDSLVLSVSGAKEVDETTAPQLLNVVREMAIAANVPMPKVYVIDDTAPNAFATGRDPQHASVAITSGLLEKLDREELQGVMGHELSHVRNFDIRFALLVGVLVGSIALLADFFLRFTFWGGGGRRSRDDDRGGSNGIQAIFFIVAIVLSILAPIAARLVQLAVNRQREYLADASSVQLTRNPYGIERALAKISSDQEVLEVANRATQHMYFTNPIKKFEERSSGLFSTHPPTLDRINRLRELTGDKPLAGAEAAELVGLDLRVAEPGTAPFEPRFFETPDELRAWFEANHETATELFVGGWRKGIARPSVTWEQIVDEALCFGWIDSIRRSLPDGAWSQRLTPRRKGSNWSAVNVANVERLRAAGRMRPAGEVAFALREAAKTGVYSFERSAEPELTPAELDAFASNAPAWDWFSGKGPGFRRQALHWVVSAKRPETRARRLAWLIEDSAAGRPPKPMRLERGTPSVD